MIQHNGMRPQDVAVLLKIATTTSEWLNKDIAQSLFLSPSEVSYSLQRSSLAGLIDFSKRKVMKKTFLDFIRYGVPHVFPAIKGPVTKGVPTTFSAPVISKYLMTNEVIVWPYKDGEARGESIGPMYPNAVKAAINDSSMYELLSLVDVMRIGKIREKDLAMQLLSEKFKVKHA